MKDNVVSKMGVSVMNDAQDPSITQSADEQFAELGYFLTANYTELDVSNNGHMYLRFITNSSTRAHIVIQLVSEGKAIFRTYSGTSYSADGTLPDGDVLTKFNRRTDSSYVSGVELRHTPSISSLGVKRGNQLVPGGSGPQSTGTTSGVSVKSNVAPNTEFLIDLQNVSGQSKDMTIIIDWYEEIE